MYAKTSSLHPFSIFFSLLQSFKLSCFNSRHIVRKIRQAHWAIWCDTLLLKDQQFCKIQKHLSESLFICRLLQAPRGMLLFWAYRRFVRTYACLFLRKLMEEKTVDFLLSILPHLIAWNNLPSLLFRCLYDRWLPSCLKEWRNVTVSFVWSLQRDFTQRDELCGRWQKFFVILSDRVVVFYMNKFILINGVPLEFSVVVFYTFKMMAWIKLLYSIIKNSKGFIFCRFHL